MIENKLNIHTLSLFPAMFEALNYGIPSQAQKKGFLQLNHHFIRDFTDNLHRSVDDRPYGGGPGMVMCVEPLKKTLDHAKKLASTPCKVVYLSPQGQPIQQARLQTILKEVNSLILVCGRYEGVDERFNHWVDETWSLGDYVMSGGELAAMVVIDCLARLIPGVLGHQDSANEESFVHGLLDHPHYTRPACYEGYKVPEVLLNGDHQAIETWRRIQALKNTWQRRPDLLQTVVLTPQQQALLATLTTNRDEETS